MGWGAKGSSGVDMAVERGRKSNGRSLRAGSTSQLGIDEAADTLLQLWHVEVDEQAYGQAGKSKIGKRLKAMDLSQLFDRLQFHERGFFDDHVSSIRGIETQPLVFQRYGHLGLNCQPVDLELVDQALSIRMLQQPRPQNLVHFDRATEDPERQAFVRIRALSGLHSSTTSLSRVPMTPDPSPWRSAVFFLSRSPALVAGQALAPPPTHPYSGSFSRVGSCRSLQFSFGSSTEFGEAGRRRS